LVQVTLVKQAGARILVIGITNQTNATELRAIASSSLDVYYVDYYTDLNSFVDSLVGSSCPLGELKQLNHPNSCCICPKTICDHISFQALITFVGYLDFFFKLEDYL